MTVPEPDPVETINSSAETEAQDNLRELTSQSWNLELLISGAALFATLSLPDLLDNVLAYYRYNLMTDTDYIHDIVPTQALGLIKGVAYLLFVAFLANFIMRAFWIGLVGLLAVFPDGIRYEQIFNLSQYARKRFAREMGSLPDYIIRLDRRCNVVFALAFGLALLLLGVAAMYGLFIMAGTLLQLTVPKNLYGPVSDLVRWAFTIGFTGLALVITILNLPKFRDNPRLAPFAFRLSQAFSLIFLGLYRPLLYIFYTFSSQIPKQVLKRRFVWIIVVFVLAEIIFMSVQLVQTQGASDLLDSRSFISLRDPSRIVDATAFDNLRTADQLIDKASIQADVIREPYVRLFVGYPKALDVELTKRFREPKWPDSFPRKVRRERRAAWYLQTFETYFGVYLNDSLYQKPGFLFTQRADNSQRGLTTVLLPTNLRPGRNVLAIMVPDSGSKHQSYCQIPFWYVPEK